MAKERGIATLLVGHVTKEGSLAGPRVLEHLVDCVLSFEGERERTYRTLRALKNRFGSTNEVGVFEMHEEGLVEVEDASARFVTEATRAPGSVVLCAMEGSRPLLVEVQALVAPSEIVPPRRIANGVDRNRLALVLAVLARHGGFSLGSADVFVSVAGGVRVDEPGADLAIALALASASKGIASGGDKPLAAFGELGLTGELRHVAHADRRTAEARKFGLTRVLHPGDGITTLRQALAAGASPGGPGNSTPQSRPRAHGEKPANRTKCGQERTIHVELAFMPYAGDDVAELEARQEPRLVRALEMVAPGTAVREGLDNIVQGHTGALICIGESEELSFLLSGGVKLEVDYTPAMLYQLAKMDGAILLASNGTKIVWANVQLMPDPTILSLETGTRHRTAERVSKQTDALVIAISASRSVVSLYLDGAKYILEDIPVVLAKANQALATLDKYRSRLDQVSTRLTALEFEGGVTLHDVLTVLQRAELVTRMAVEIERYIVELGAEGRLIEMQLEETMVGVAADKSALVRDYIVEASEEGFAMVLDSLARLPHQDLLDFGRLAELLGYDRKLNTLDHPASPRGYRILGRIPRLPKMVVQSIVSEFNGLDEILAAADPELEGVEGVGDLRAKDIREGLRRLQEINLVDRYLQT